MDAGLRRLVGEVGHHHPRHDDRSQPPSPAPRAEGLRAPLARWLAEGRAMLEPGDESPDRVQRRFRIAATDFGMMAMIGPAMTRLERLVTAQLDADSPRRLQDGSLDLMNTGFEPNPARFHHRFLFRDGFDYWLAWQ